MMSYAYDLSEQMRTPVLMRITTRMAHSRAAVEVQESGKEVTCTGRPSVPSDWVLLPGNARRRYVEAIATQEKLRDEAEQSAFNRLAGQEGMLRRESWLVELVTISDGNLSGWMSVSFAEDFTVSFTGGNLDPSGRLLQRDSGSRRRTAFC